MTDIKTIVLVEDNPNDVELTFEALVGYHLAVRKLGYFWAVLNERPSASGTTSDRHE